LEVSLQTLSGAASYFWDYGDGTSSGGSFITNHIYSNLGSTTLTFETVLQTTSAYGCVATDTVEIVVDPIPQPNFTASPEVQMFPEAGNAVVTFDNSTAPGPWTFVYDFGDGSTPLTTTSLSDVIHEYSSHGVYLVKLYTNKDDCIDSASTIVTVNPRPPVAIFNSIVEGCHPLEVDFSNASLSSTSYTWQFGDGSLSIEENPTHVFYQPGEYTVKLTANGPGGSDQVSLEIQVNPTPEVFFNYAPDSVFVNDKPVKFFNLTSYAEDYLWNFGDVSIYDNEIDQFNTSTESDPTHVYMYEGWKDVLLVASNEYCIDSLFIPLAVKVIPAGELKFPSVFKPGDSPTGGLNVNNLSDADRNRVFFPGVNKQVSEYHLFIYNRWGELIFQSDDINIGWDGFIRDRKASQGVYIWKVTGIYSNGAPFSDAGDITLIWQ
jgi:PKD repeat protein